MAGFASTVPSQPAASGFSAGFWTGFASAAALGALALLGQRRAHRRQQHALAEQRQKELDQVVARRTADLVNANRTLRDLADTDALTGVSNRRHFDRLLREGVERALLTGRRLSVLLIDVDHFKQVNDREGHLAGDEVLRQLGQLLQRAVRSDTVVARYGGEEFAVITPSGLAEAVGLAERLRRAVEADSRIRVSLGVASFEPKLDGDEPALLARADRALYAAKAAGRNRVESDPPGAPVTPQARRGAAIAAD
ncbi:GGDEF domain-containing protein [Aquimonas voraii]|uniref:GGDEF domain-containing protein n=1 Tax=Aquimonas voraii TaxID=265719 RepID=UPI0015A3B9E6|nr:GGDEF domain-containing protein [Aquimonas voraii]